MKFVHFGQNMSLTLSSERIMVNTLIRVLLDAALMSSLSILCVRGALSHQFVLSKNGNHPFFP